MQKCPQEGLRPPPVGLDLVDLASPSWSHLGTSNPRPSQQKCLNNNTKAPFPRPHWPPGNQKCIFTPLRCPRPPHPKPAISAQRGKFRVKTMHPWLLSPMARRDMAKSTLLAAAHVTRRGFSELPSLQQLLFALPLFAAASHLDARQEGKKNQPMRPPPAEQPLNQNKAGAAAKSWEALLFNAEGPQPGEPPQRAGAGAAARRSGAGGGRSPPREPTHGTGTRPAAQSGSPSPAAPCTAILLSAAACPAWPFPPKPDLVLVPVLGTRVHQHVLVSLAPAGGPKNTFWGSRSWRMAAPGKPAPAACSNLETLEGLGEVVANRFRHHQPDPWRRYRSCPDALVAAGSTRVHNKSGHAAELDMC